ncbi:MAG: class I SAM-dependent methyltransferase [Ignavibacteria bacterium]|nr:class I SAM-dependent methyltransferase [Ignavibacteria bacterium]
MANNYSLVAEYYDVFVRSAIDIPFFLEQCRKVDGKVLELMAGTGRASLPLLEAGVKLTCVDSSAEMVSLLKRKLISQGRNATVYRMDVRELNLGELFDLVIVPFHSFAELVTEADRSAALEGIYRHLNQGGAFICTMHNPEVRLNTVDGAMRMVGKYEVHEEGHSLIVWLSEQFRGSSGVIDAVEILEEYDAENIMCTRRYMPMEYTFMSDEEAGREFREAGFAVQTLYGNYDCAPFVKETSPFMIWALKK